MTRQRQGCRAGFPKSALWMMAWALAVMLGHERDASAASTPETAPSFQWARAIAKGNVVAKAVTTDSSGNVIVCGFHGSVVPVDFGEEQLPSPEQNKWGFLAKYDTKGYLVWSRLIRGFWDAQALDVATDKSGIIYVVGGATGSATLGNQTLPETGEYGFVAACSPNGEFLWATPLGTNTRSKATRVAIDPEGNLICAGWFRGPAAFGSAVLPATGEVNVFIAKVSYKGRLVWAQTPDGRNMGGVGTDKAGNYYLGWDNGAIYTNGEPLARGAVVTKYSPEGTVLRQTDMGSLQGLACASTPEGELYYTGYFYKKAQVGAFALKHPSLGHVLARVDAQGEIKWVQTLDENGVLGRDGNASMLALSADGEESVVVAGEFTYQVAVGGQPGASDMLRAIFAAKYRPDGALAWFRPVGPVAGGTVFGVKTQGDTTYLVGPLTGEAQFDDIKLAPAGSSIASWSQVSKLSTGKATRVPPRITGQPIDTTGDAGKAVQFNVSAGGSDPLLYRWLFNGTPIAGAGRPLLSLTNIASAAAGDYRVVVSNPGGSVTSAVARLQVNVPPKRAPGLRFPFGEFVIRADTQRSALISISDADTPLAGLSLTVSSSAPELIPDTGLVFTGTGADRLLNITPQKGQTGAARVRIVLTDTDGLTASGEFEVRVTREPTLIFTGLSDMRLTAGGSVGIRNFQISNPAGPVSGIQVTASSSVTSVLADTDISMAGGGGTWTLRVKPLANRAGTTTITLTARDTDGAQATFLVAITILPTNTPPEIAGLADQILRRNDSSLSVPFFVADLETPFNELVVTAQSSNPGLISELEIAAVTDGFQRTLRIIPAPNHSGEAVIQLTVSDGEQTTTAAFRLQVEAPAGPPFISPIRDVQATMGEIIAPVRFTVSDSDTPLDQLQITAASSNQRLLADAGISVVGGGAVRELNFSPVSNETGTSVITVRASDGQLEAGRDFTLVVQARPTPLALTTWREGQDLILAWPMTLGEVVIEGAVALDLGNWREAVEALRDSGNRARLPITAETRFYRLRRK